MYAGLRAATEHSDYQISSHAEQRYVCLGGIRSTGLTVVDGARRGGARRCCDECGLEARPKAPDELISVRLTTARRESTSARTSAAAGSSATASG